MARYPTLSERCTTPSHSLDETFRFPCRGRPRFSQPLQTASLPFAPLHEAPSSSCCCRIRIHCSSQDTSCPSPSLQVPGGVSTSPHLTRELTSCPSASLFNLKSCFPLPKTTCPLSCFLPPSYSKLLSSPLILLLLSFPICGMRKLILGVFYGKFWL